MNSAVRSSTVAPTSSAATISGKSAPEAEKVRIIGNQLYRFYYIMEARKYYSESIAFAPADSEEVALAYGNRSAVLLRLRKYRLCMLDINRALELQRLQERPKEKLLKRKEECWKKIQEEKLEKIMLTKIVGRGPSNIVERGFSYIDEISIDDSDSTIDYSVLDDPIWLTKFDNPLLSNFSSKVKLDYNSDCGRHWVATDNIGPGEILAIENIFALRLLRKVDQLYNHCAYCTVWCDALIPCPSCPLQMYCSKRCRQEAYNTYHRIECKVLPLLSFDENQENILLAFRIFLIGTKQGSKLIDLMNDPDVYKSLDGERNCVGVPYTNDYSSILNLRWRLDDRPPLSSNSEILSFVCSMLDALRSVGFFEYGREEKQENLPSLTDTESFAAFFMFHHVLLLSKYSSDINADYSGLVNDPKNGLRKIGSSLSSHHSLMNHSCDANTLVVKDKRRQLVCSTRPIKAGEQIYTSYISNYTIENRENRRKLLQKKMHVRVCNCRACTEDWPTKGELLKRKNTYLITEKNIIEYVEKMDKWLLDANSKRVSEYTEEDFRKVLEFNTRIRRYVKEPSSTIMLCEEFIKEFMMKKGNFYITMTTATQIDYVQS